MSQPRSEHVLLDTDAGWAPAACTLPTVEQPLRIAEFDELFKAARGLHRDEPTGLRVELEPTSAVAALAADLMVRETQCCSFFTFALATTGGSLHLDVSVPQEQTEVLDALATRAAEAAGGTHDRTA